ncbi:hypothetical protein GQF56_23300 [Rhodobacter sphaeroides]|uniref:Plasmid recombination enzyme n=1 Tax=Cereibacter sphaeroides (strain ATCC 17023 / DSM 158 / JCM 6121 / CCUG 31486 / LMG 2827 / NBRC 12203 / NCIMB 8253 / ATH 2.4.1.) TaxID=272943 RepID=Q3IV62_CERS4|nr:hypothetical protein [Cereibacter sphaeroides]ABA81572.1 hypothetical protein RSP_4103 [Cereibacter sphaeroides 2.4.1]AMJ50119.1 hypothetical protein APX01_21440 [Cereibacter sphaeroides]ANS36741.1 hypothetical protein A3858_20990 [Cereibacter sphaeroides]ATN65920.1 hypothetical protein A3857_21625 [Cereibacter sphaeroides]AXC63999.1 hypothetical protein DQL45_21660 [Cereibacter sphaeroides 2.4.1]
MSEKCPVVLRFAALFPSDLARYVLHEERRGRGSEHCVTERKYLNRPNLIGDADWRERLELEIAAARDENFAEELAALKRLKRKKEWLARGKEGPKDPWNATEAGPLREVILTVNKDWFETPSDPSKLFDTAEKERREADFTAHACEWLTSRFGDMVVTARADHDETALHLHAIIVPWVEKTSGRRGTQRLIQPTSHPLIASYEAAQDDVGAFFAPLGLRRGEARARARREAKGAAEAARKRVRDAGGSEAEAQAAWDKAMEAAPQWVQHKPTHIWRQEEQDRLDRKDRELKEQEATLAASDAQLASKADWLENRAATLTKRETAVADREAETDAAAAVLEAVGAGQVDPERLDQPEELARLAAAAPDLHRRMTASPAKAGPIRQRLANAFRSTRQQALRAADALVAERLGAADRLAAAAGALRDAMLLALPKGLRDKILAHVSTVSQAFDDAQAALSTRERTEARDTRRDDER